LTRSLLVECGEALYGPLWQCAIARDLGVADRTVRRWVAGTTPVPDSLRPALLRLAQDRSTLLQALARRLRERERG
jgi:transposase-like protein